MIFPEIQGWFNIQKHLMEYTVSIKDEKDMIISTDTEKAFDKLNSPSWQKHSTNEVWKETSQPDKKHKKKTLTANIILNGESLDAFPPRSVTRQDACDPHFYSTLYWRL